MEENEVPILIYSFTIILFILALFILLFYLLFKKKQKAHHLKITALNEAILQTQIEIQEQTFKNISQEIHDNIGQVLTLVKLNLGTISNVHEGSTQQQIQQTRELVSKVIVDLRDLARSMHGERVAEIGLQNSIENELKIIQGTGEFQTHISIKGEPYNLQAQTQMVLFRIVQEALHNEIKHSRAKNIYVEFIYSASEFILQIKDDGIGFNINGLTASKAGIGLKNMKNRAALIGGNFSIHSSENNGTTILINIPKEISKSLVQ